MKANDKATLLGVEGTILAIWERCAWFLPQGQGPITVPLADLTSAVTEVPLLAWSDKRQNRGYSPMLFVGVGDRIERFEGKTIPGVVAVVRSDYRKNGKWSGTNYQLKLACGAWLLHANQEWESGERFHGCSAVADMIKQFRDAGCKAIDEAIIDALQQHCPNTLERVRKTEADIASVS